MRPRLKRFTQFAVEFALCTMLLSLCASAGHAQGISPSRAAAGARNGTGLAGLESLEAIQSQPTPSPRVRIQAETISVHELLVPGGAIKEFQRSQKAVRSGNFESAAEHLQKALQIYPNFVQAHNNLGASYIQLNEYERAIPEFQKAIDLDPKILEAYRNLGLGLFLLGRYPEAEIAARQAMQLNPRLGLARYTLGRILAAEGSTSAEAEQLLRGTTSEFVDARLPLAQVLLNKRDTEQAANELRTYLKSGDADPAKVPAVKCWLSRITQGKAGASCSGSRAGS
jgi:tetratricopeptide (TPR) repeat protein